MVVLVVLEAMVAVAKVTITPLLAAQLVPVVLMVEPTQDVGEPEVLEELVELGVPQVPRVTLGQLAQQVTVQVDQQGPQGPMVVPQGTPSIHPQG